MQSIITRLFGPLVAFALLLTAPAAGHAASYTYTKVARPGSAITTLYDVNNSGQMVGFSFADHFTGPQAFVYADGVFTALSGPAGAVTSSAMGISDSGTIVGTFTTSLASDFAQGFIYSGGTYTTLQVNGADWTQLRGISPDGRYISGIYQSTAIQAFVYDTLSATFAFVGSGTATTIAQGINKHGVMVGSDTLFATDSLPGFIYDIPTGARTDVELPGAVRTAFRAIDDAGVVSGWFHGADDVIHGFTGYPGALQQIDVAGADHTLVQGSNNAGVLVGSFQAQYDVDLGDYAEQAGFIAIPTAVPEPQTWALMAAGLLLLTRVRSRR